MVKQKKNKSFKKSLKKRTHKKKLLQNICNSVYVLYFIVMISLLNIFILLFNKENESVFLFIIIASIIYMNNKNMIIVLGIPFIVVNTLRFIKKKMNRNYIEEGFEVANQEVYTKELFQKFIKTRFNTDKSYQDYTMTLEGLTPINELIQNVLNNKDSKGSVFDDTPIIELVDYLEFMHGITEDDDLFNNNQVKYSKNLIKDYKVFENDIIENKKKSKNMEEKKEEEKKEDQESNNKKTTKTKEGFTKENTEGIITQKDVKTFMNNINTFIGNNTS